MKLKIERPIVFFDLETTGVDRENDRIVEIALCRYDVSGQYKTISRRVNPEMPIPKGASDVHGIKDEDVANEPTFKQIAKSLLDRFEGCDVAGFKSNSFDVPLLFNEFTRAGLYWDYTQFKMLDAGNLFKIKEPRTLTAAYKFYKNKDLIDAHNAAADIEATMEVFLSQLTRYEDDPEFPQTVEELALYTNFGNKIVDISGKFYYDKEGEIRFSTGKHKDKLAKLERGYLDWMKKANFPADTVKIIDELLSKK